MTTRAAHWHGHEAWVMEDAGLRAVVLPAHGGKIASLVDAITGREWLWSNPLLELALPRADASYVREFDSGGFDECFPAVSAGPYPAPPWQDLQIPDHGELWSVGWDAACDGEALVMVARTRRFPVRFERRLSLKAGRLRLDYQVSNPTAHAFPFIWSSHPLLALEEGMQIDLPLGHRLEVYGSDRLGDRHTSVTWPHAAGLDLSRVARTGYSAKLSGPAPARGWVGVRHAQRMLRMAFDPACVTDLGLWLNMGGWTPFADRPAYFNLGLEPCIGWGDDLAYARARGLSHGCLEPFGARRWHLELSFDPAPAREASRV